MSVGGICWQQVRVCEADFRARLRHYHFIACMRIHNNSGAIGPSIYHTQAATASDFSLRCHSAQGAGPNVVDSGTVYHNCNIHPRATVYRAVQNARMEQYCRFEYTACRIQHYQFCLPPRVARMPLISLLQSQGRGSSHVSHHHHHHFNTNSQHDFILAITARGSLLCCVFIQVNPGTQHSYSAGTSFSNENTNFNIERMMRKH